MCIDKPINDEDWRTILERVIDRRSEVIEKHDSEWSPLSRKPFGKRWSIEKHDGEWSKYRCRYNTFKNAMKKFAMIEWVEHLSWHIHSLPQLHEHAYCSQARRGKPWGVCFPMSFGAYALLRRRFRFTISEAQWENVTNRYPVVISMLCTMEQWLQRTCWPRSDCFCVQSVVASSRCVSDPAAMLGSRSADTWLILPVVICLSQRLSHACLSISRIWLSREWLITTALVYWILESYLDNCGNSRANTRN